MPTKPDTEAGYPARIVVNEETVEDFGRFVPLQCALEMTPSRPSLNNHKSVAN